MFRLSQVLGLNRIGLAGQAVGAVSPKMTAGLSMLFSGFYTQGRLAGFAAGLLRNNTRRRFRHRRDKGVWESLLGRLVHEPDFEWPVIEGIDADYLLADRA